MKENVNKHLIVEILLRLPVRSLLRFKCVSKPWRSLICSSQFAKSHFDLAAAPSDRILTMKDRIFDDLIDSKDLDDESVVSLRLPPPPPIFYTTVEFWGSCRGFVLLRYVDTSVKNIHLPFISDLIVWNPSTGEHKRVLHSGAKMKCVDSSYAVGFGYDASTDDYLVILKNFKCKYGSEYKAQFMLFSFKTNSWSHLRDPYEGKEQYKEKIYSFEAGLLLNGHLHWLAFSSFGVEVIVAFDLGKRILSEIPLPPDTADAHDIELHTIGGCLAVSCRFSEWSEIWVMKEYNLLSSWTRIFASPFWVNDGEFFKSNLIRPRPEEITNKTFESIFCALRLEQFDGKICGNNYGCQRLEACNQQGLCEHIACGRGLVLFGKFLWLTMYKESLLSLPNDSRETSQEP